MLPLAIGLQMGGQLIGSMYNKRAAYDQMAEAGWANVTQNKNIDAINFENTVRNMYRQGILQVQRGQMLEQAASAGLTLSQQKLQALSAASLTAGASGTAGASVAAVAADVAKRAEDALLIQKQQVSNSNFNFGVQAQDLAYAGIDSLQNARLINLTDHQSSFGQDLLLAGLNAGATYASAWYGKNGSLGTAGTQGGTMTP